MATHASYPSGLELPSPLRSAAPFVALCVLALLVEIDPRLPWLVGVAAGGCFAAAGGLRAAQAHHELVVLRRATDRVIARGVGRGTASPAVTWRSAELTRPERRHALLRTTERTLRRLDGSRLPSASPLNRVSARRTADLLETLAARLGELDRPVTARGILLAEWLLGDPSSPLYAPGGGASLPRDVTRVLAALEP